MKTLGEMTNAERDTWSKSGPLPHEMTEFQLARQYVVVGFPVRFLEVCGFLNDTAAIARVNGADVNRHKTARRIGSYKTAKAVFEFARAIDAARQSPYASHKL